MRRGPERGAGPALALAATLVAAAASAGPDARPGVGLGAGLVAAPAPVADTILLRLIDGAHRAFALTGEDAVWDALAAVAVEPALSALYLARQRSLLAHDGQPATVEVVEVTLEHAGPPGAGGRIPLRWRVLGLLSHFGHRHGLIDRYEALVRLADSPEGPRLAEIVTLRVERDGAGLTGHTE